MATIVANIDAMKKMAQINKIKIKRENISTDEQTARCQCLALLKQKFSLVIHL
jgi:hypothetical protein